MHILLTGGTGLIGQALCHAWRAQGHQLVVWSRNPQQVATLCGAGVRGIGNLAELGDSAIDAVVNLAGAPIADRPWTPRRKATLRASRIALTVELVTWIRQRATRPAVLLSASAIGWYGDGGEQELRESSPPGQQDFASRLCQDWEDAARQAEALGVRVILLRTGLVLARTGGLLQRMRLPFQLGLGGPLGNGRQWMPWIHLQDQVAAIDFLLQQSAAQGSYNLCAPHPVRNAVFARHLGRQLHRPAFLPLPAPLLRLLLGELACLLLAGQNARPSRLLESGFEFRFADLDAALGDLLAE